MRYLYTWRTSPRIEVSLAARTDTRQLSLKFVWHKILYQSKNSAKLVKIKNVKCSIQLDWKCANHHFLTNNWKLLAKRRRQHTTMSTKSTKSKVLIALNFLVLCIILTCSRSYMYVNVNQQNQWKHSINVELSTVIWVDYRQARTV